MNEYKENKHIGVYGLIIENDKILLIRKAVGPYTGKLDLPGGSFEFGERPEETLKRELLEEVGIEIKEYELYDADSIRVDWIDDNTKIKTHHIGIFYKVTKYENEIRKDIEIDSQNDDSLGAEFYDIKKLHKNQLSSIAILELEKLGLIKKSIDFISKKC